MFTAQHVRLRHHHHQLSEVSWEQEFLASSDCNLVELQLQSGFLAMLEASSANLTLGDGGLCIGCVTTGARDQRSGSRFIYVVFVVGVVVVWVCP